MASLPDKLVSQFAKMLKPDNSKKETTVYGTIVQQGTSMFVQLDGSDLLTPISSTVDVLPGERVTALIKNHSVIVNGNITSPAARTGTVVEIDRRTSVSQLVNTIYPIGSLYLTASSISPETLFTGTKWEQIKDRFLLSAGDSYELGATGGEATHKLTTNEMPAHTHAVQVYSANNTTYKMATAGLRFSGVSWTASGETTAGSTGGDNAGITESTGGGAAHNNMPPYLAVNVWKRIE